jgi:hypothetical protein
MMEVSLVNDGPVTIVTDSHYLTFKKLIILDIILHLYYTNSSKMNWSNRG